MITLIIGAILALFTFKVSIDLGGEWYWALFAAMIPLAFCYYLGVIGVIIGAVFLGTLVKVGM